MAYDSRVFRILIASPSDVYEEREAAVRVIQQWNDLYSYSRKVTLLPLRWETHTAPEYGSRPQEIINRAIVDECDLLIGIFWTRIGTPTGVADSGTLEEIERVGNAKKSIMLYFSRVPADPESIDSAQIERLREFKKKTYPNGLVESYRSHTEFTDKLTRQLEMRVRDLQAKDSSGIAPVRLEFIQLDSALPIGERVAIDFDIPNVTDLNKVVGPKSAELKDVVQKYVKAKSYVPVPMALVNTSPAALRNLYVEFVIEDSSQATELTMQPDDTVGTSWWSSIEVLNYLDTLNDGSRLITTPITPISSIVKSKLAIYGDGELQRVDDKWRIAFEWEALQAQRTRMVRPVLYACVTKSTSLSVRAKISADSFAKPLVLEAQFDVRVRIVDVSIDTVFQGWREFLKRSDKDTSAGKRVIAG